MVAPRLLRLACWAPMISHRGWVFWVRGPLLSAICGAWVAHVLFDPDEYLHAGLRFTWRASVPIFVQTLLLLLVVASLGPLSRARSHTNAGPARRLKLPQLLLLLATSQLTLFLLMEVSERLVQREPFTDGLFASGFVLELMFALGSALVLTLLGSVALRVIGSLPRRSVSVTLRDHIDPVTELFVRTRHVICEGDPRAPPLAVAG